MTRKRHTEEQIIAVLKDAQAGVSVQELCRGGLTGSVTIFDFFTHMSQPRTLDNLRPSTANFMKMVTDPIGRLQDEGIAHW